MARFCTIQLKTHQADQYSAVVLLLFLVGKLRSSILSSSFLFLLVIVCVFKLFVNRETNYWTASISSAIILRISNTSLVCKKKYSSTSSSSSSQEILFTFKGRRIFSKTKAFCFQPLFYINNSIHLEDFTAASERGKTGQQRSPNACATFAPWFGLAVVFILSGKRAKNRRDFVLFVRGGHVFDEELKASRTKVT